MQFVTVFIARPNTKHMNLMQSLMLAVIRMQMHLIPNHLLSPYSSKCTLCQRSCWLLLAYPRPMHRKLALLWMHTHAHAHCAGRVFAHA
jgi:hypothetical protein